MTLATLERPVPTTSHLDLLRTRPDFTLRNPTPEDARQLREDIAASRIACCETEQGWNVWKLHGRAGR